MVQDNVASFSAPQLAAMCGAYVQLCRHSYNDSHLFDAIVEQVLRSFKVRYSASKPDNMRITSSLLSSKAGPVTTAMNLPAILVACCLSEHMVMCQGNRDT